MSVTTLYECIFSVLYMEMKKNILFLNSTLSQLALSSAPHALFSKPLFQCRGFGDYCVQVVTQKCVTLLVSV